MLLIRHTAVVAQPGICYGRSEIPVAASFAADVDAVMVNLRDKLNSYVDQNPQVIWTSPALRCRVVATALRERWREFGESEIEPVIRIDERLAELNFGEWEGRHWDTLRGPEVDAWMRDPWCERPPGGETAAEMWARIGAFRAERDRGKDHRDLVVTHAGVIRAWRSLAERRDWRELFAEKIPFGSLWLT